MITYLMDNYKNLRKTVDGKIYQREKLVDKIQFLIPQKYEEIELKDFTVALEYKDTNNILRTEILNIQDENYKEKYLQYVIPIDTKITRYAGDVIFWLSFVKNDITENTQYVLHTSNATLTVSPLQDLYDFVPDESLAYIDQKIAQMDAKIEAVEIMANAYDVEKADDIEISEDKTEITLTSDGKPIGTPILLAELHDATEETLGGESLTVVEL